MRSAGEFDHGAIAAEESFDIGQVFPDRDLVTLPFIAFVPLIVVVKNQRDDVVKVVDEPVGPGRIDETVKPVVEVGKIVIAPIDLVQQREMLLAQRLDLPPKRRAVGKCREGRCRSQLEHLADLKQFEREARRKALENPSGIRPPLDEAEALEAIQEFADAGCCHSELASQLEFIDGRSRSRIVSEHPLHEALLHLCRQWNSLGFRKSPARSDRGANDALSPASVDATLRGQHRHDLAHRRTAHSEPGAQNIFGR